MPDQTPIGRADFEKEYLAHKDRLLTLAAAFTGNRHAAEDVVHDVFAGLIQRQQRPHHEGREGHEGRLTEEWSGNGNLGSYLTVCVRNRAIDGLRKGGAARGTQTDSIMTLAAKPSSAPSEEEAMQLLKSVSLLPDDLRDAVTLRIWGEMSFQEIAEIQGTTKSTAHDRYQQALERLRTEVKGVI